MFQSMLKWLKSFTRQKPFPTITWPSGSERVVLATTLGIGELHRRVRMSLMRLRDDLDWFNGSYWIKPWDPF